MRKELVQYLEAKVENYGGEYGLNHSRRLIRLVEILAETNNYNIDVITFCAYVHDFGAYSEFLMKGVDHALRSDEIVDQFMKEFHFSEEEKAMIHEIILSHHKPGALPVYEATLFRDADALDFMGFIGIARDFARAQKDMKKAIQSIEEHQKRLMKSVTLERTKEIMMIREKEMKVFLDIFYRESFNLY